MASKPSILSIPNPCHESWEGMAPSEAGRHCASCRKEVVDFSTMTDDELARYLNAFPGFGCGQFRPDQLGRPILAASPEPRSLKSAAARIAASVAMLLSLNVQASAQTDGSKQSHIKGRPKNITVERKKPATKDAQCTHIAGTIVNTADKGIANAALEILRDNVVIAATSSASAGRFRTDIALKVPDGAGLIVRIMLGVHSMDMAYVVGAHTKKLVVQVPQPVIEIREPRILGATSGSAAEPDIASMLSLQKRRPGFFRRLFRRV